jgi:hypothetical protein
MSKNSQTEEYFPSDRSKGSVFFTLSHLATLLAWIALPFVVLPLGNTGPLFISSETSFWAAVAGLVLSICAITLRYLVRGLVWINLIDHRLRDHDTIGKVLLITYWPFWISVVLTALFSPPLIHTVEAGFYLP